MFKLFERRFAMPHGVGLKGTDEKVCRDACVLCSVVKLCQNELLCTRELSEHSTRSAPTALARHGRPADNVSRIALKPEREVGNWGCAQEQSLVRQTVRKSVTETVEVGT